MENKYTYQTALEEVLKIREQRRKIYGDGWVNDPDWLIFSNMYNKMLRLQTFIIDKNTNYTYENEVDTIIDLVNYALFLLTNKLNHKQK